MEKISIIMSTYKEVLTQLDTSVTSILSQTHKDIELIIVIDNPFNDDIKALVQKYASEDNRIKVVENERNFGLTASLNKALQYCNGEYIARMDADDISDPERLESELAYLKAHNLDLVGCMTRRIDENGNILNALTNLSNTPEYLSKKLMFDNCIAHPTWLAKKTVYTRLHGYRDIKTAEDYDFLLRAKHAGLGLGICDKCLFSYRVNTAGISRSNSLRQMLTSHILQKEYLRIEQIDQRYIDSCLEHKLSESANNQFEKGVQLVDFAMEQVKKKNPLAFITVIRALFCSKYIWIKLYKIFKLHTIS